MNNSPLVSYTKISPHKTSPRNHKIDTITIHCIVGQWTAQQGCDYFSVAGQNCSANYVVGKDGSIGLSVEEKDRSWCSSSSSNDNRAVTIEVASDVNPPYMVTDAAYLSLVKLCADICRRNGIKELKWKADKSLIGKVDQQNMTVHRWFANKACPGDYLYNLHGKIAEEVNHLLGVSSTPAKPAEPTAPEPTTFSYQAGDIVNFTGTKHYISSIAANGKTCKPGKARVTAIARKGKHPVHLIAVAGGGSSVHGWVDTEFIAENTATLAVGAKVRVNAGAKTYEGKTLSSFVYNNTYDVLRVQGNRVVIGVGSAVTAAMHLKDLTVV